MRNLLELREKLKKIYANHEVYILPILKFLLAFLALKMLNSRIGYMGSIDNLGIELIVALTCSFLPTTFIVVFAGLFSLLHMYAISLEVAIVGLGVYMVMFFLFFRFGTKDAIIVLITTILAMMGIPVVMPIVVGLLASPLAAVPVVCGLIVYTMISTISINATTISSMGGDEATAKLRLILDGLIENPGLIVMIASFVITIFIVYFIRRMSVAYSWTIAMVAGAIVNLVILLVGDLMYNINLSLFVIFLSSLLAVAVGKIIEFMCFCVDYSRIETLQFEDEEYYYYVKAIPKMLVAEQDKTVKRINVQRNNVQHKTSEPISHQSRIVSEGKDGAVKRSTTQGNVRQGNVTKNSVTKNSATKNSVTKGSVTIGNERKRTSDSSNDWLDDYEDLERF